MASKESRDDRFNHSNYVVHVRSDNSKSNSNESIHNRFRKRSVRSSPDSDSTELHTSNKPKNNTDEVQLVGKVDYVPDSDSEDENDIQFQLVTNQPTKRYTYSPEERDIAEFMVTVTHR